MNNKIVMTETTFGPPLMHTHSPCKKILPWCC